MTLAKLFKGRWSASCKRTDNCVDIISLKNFIFLGELMGFE